MNISRRGFFTQFGRSMVTELFSKSSTETSGNKEDQGRAPSTKSSTWLRPPGAVAESMFLRHCVRCTDCIDACPHGSIRTLTPEMSSTPGTPAIIVEESPCYLCEDLPCITACAPQVLAPTKRRDVRMGRMMFDREKCYLSAGQPCDDCIARCPLTGEAIRLGDAGIPVVDPTVCVGCGVCAHICPTNALTVVPTFGEQEIGVDATFT